MPGVPQEVKEQIELEKRALAIVHAALNDETFIQGVLESYKAEVNGDPGEPWAKVKAELGIV